MAEKTTAEFYFVINEKGEWDVAVDKGDAQWNGEGEIQRTVKLTVKITAPIVETIDIDIPDTAGSTEQIEIAAE